MEGIRTTKAVLELAKRSRVEMPITQAVYNVIHGGFTIEEAIQKLFARDLIRPQNGSHDYQVAAANV